MRREVPIAITIVTGLIMLLNSFMEVNMGSTSLATLAAELSKWIIIVSALMVGIATVNLMRVHGNNVSRQRPSWINSLALLVTLILYSVVGIYSRSYPASEAAKNLYQNMFDYLLSPLGAAMFAIIAFYIASASYRAFRMRSVEATVLLLAAVLVMLGKAPVGELIWSKFPEISTWLLNVPNTAGQRAIMIGAAIGAFVTSMRVLFGVERGHLGGTE